MKKRVLIGIVLAILISGCIGGWLFFDHTYIILNGETYSRDANYITLTGETLPEIEKLQALTHMETLDIQSIPVTNQQYIELQQLFPECTILWCVPFQGNAIPNQISALSVSSLTEDDLAQLAYMPQLQHIVANGCTDYDLLLRIKEIYPGLDVHYTVRIGSVEIANDATSVSLNENTAEELLRAITYLPELQTVTATGQQNYSALMQVKSLRPEIEIHYDVTIGSESFAENTTQLVFENADEADLLSMLPYLPALTDVTFTANAPDNDVIYQMMCLRPDVTFHWTFTMFGTEVSSTATELNLSGIQMSSTDEVEAYLKYFQNLERVEMCHCGIPSDQMDAMAQRYPDIRFVWAIQIGNGTLRTDAIAFIPYKIGYDIDNPLYDKDCTELKYCIDLICLDLGHMRMTDYSFLAYMPNMKYLLLGDTPGTDFSPLENLTELIYLEIFNTKFSQTEMLLNFTKLEDLNIGFTRNHDFEVLKQLTWLKRLWLPATGLTGAQYTELKAALPDTQLAMYVEGSTGGNWRDNQNYRDMRDLLGMYYMK